MCPLGDNAFDVIPSLATGTFSTVIPTIARWNNTRCSGITAAVWPCGTLQCKCMCTLLQQRPLSREPCVVKIQTKYSFEVPFTHHHIKRQEANYQIFLHSFRGGHSESLTFVSICVLCLPLQVDGGTQTQPLHYSTGLLLTANLKMILCLQIISSVQSSSIHRCTWNVLVLCPFKM